jgi:hypothetical protein
MPFDWGTSDRSLICRTLMASMDKADLWKEEEPSEEAVQLYEQMKKGKGLPWNAAEKVLFGLAWSIWNYPTEGLNMDLTEMYRLDQKQLRMVGELFLAMGGGGSVKLWAAKYL